MRKNCPPSATELVRIIAISATSESDDLFGPIMNMCSKINSKAPPNGVAIGDGLYKVIETFSSLSSLEENCYHFEELVTLEHEFNKYPLYSLQRNSPIASFREPDWQPSSTNILLIDDEEDIVYTFKQGLCSEGYNVEALSLQPKNGQLITIMYDSVSIQSSLPPPWSNAMNAHL